MKKHLLIILLLFNLVLYSQNKVKKIIFSTDGYSSNPDFELVIYCNKLAVLNAKDNNYNTPKKGETVGYGINNEGINIRDTEIKGIFTTRLKNEKFKKIIHLISELDNKFKISKFNSNTIHNSVASLKVIYNSGLIKNVYDNGMDSNKNLITLYKYFMDLRFNQKWK